jgi:hypothetical protein
VLIAIHVFLKPAPFQTAFVCFALPSLPTAHDPTPNNLSTIATRSINAPTSSTKAPTTFWFVIRVFRTSKNLAAPCTRLILDLSAHYGSPAVYLNEPRKLLTPTPVTMPSAASSVAASPFAAFGKPPYGKANAAPGRHWSSTLQPCTPYTHPWPALVSPPPNPAHLGLPY